MEKTYTYIYIYHTYILIILIILYKLYYIILYYNYIILYDIILYYIILHYFILYYIILYITTILFPIEWTMWKPWFDDWHLTVTEKPWCLFRISFSVGSNPATQIYLGTWWDWLQLVGVWPTPLKNMSQLGWWLFPIYGKIIQMFQTNNQLQFHQTKFFALLDLQVTRGSSSDLFQGGS